MIVRKYRCFLLLALSMLIAACGGGAGSGSSNSQGPNPPQRPPPTSVFLTSDAWDFIGQGLAYSYSQADAAITIEVTGTRLSIRVEGDESWRGDFIFPSTFTTLTAGTYTNLTRYPFHDDAVGGMDWSGEHRGCNQLTGTLVIENVTFNGTALATIELTFEQFCENGLAAMHGDIYWDASDSTVEV